MATRLPVRAPDPPGPRVHPAARLGRLRRCLPLRAGHAAPQRRGQGACRATSATPTCGACSTPRPTCSRTCRRTRRSSRSTRRASRPTAGRTSSWSSARDRSSPALPHRAHPRRRGARDRRPDGERAGVRAPRGARPPRREAEQHPHHDVRHAGARRLRHLVVAAARRPPTRCWRCRSRGARPRWSPSRPPARSRARCGASARPSTRCSPATAPSSGASAARTPRSSCVAASPAPRYTDDPARRCAGVPAGGPRHAR